MGKYELFEKGELIVIVLGIDPGYAIVGWGVIEFNGNAYMPKAFGSITTEAHTDFNERLDRMSHGTGDVYASVFAGAVLRGKSALDAAALAADVVCEAIRATDDDHWYGVSFERAIPFLVGRLA